MMLKTFVLFVFLFLSANFTEASVTLKPLCKYDKEINDFPFVGKVINVQDLSAGSGVVIGDGSFVLTARHVITHDGSQRGMLLDASNFSFFINEKSYSVEKVYGHDYSDIAILKLNEKIKDTVKIVNSDDILGKTFYGVGFGKSSSLPSAKEIEWNLPYGDKRIYKNKFHARIKQLTVNSSFEIVEEQTIAFYLEGIKEEIMPGQGIHGPGDSGGGIFILNADNTFSLVAVITALTPKEPIIGVMADLFSCKKWIESIAPDSFGIQSVTTIDIKDYQKQMIMDQYPFFDVKDRDLICAKERKRLKRKPQFVK